jgi:GGDEF domain-containing protein
VLLVHTPDSDAAMISERIRERIQGEPFETVPPPGRVVLSIGLASFPTDSTSDLGLLAHAQAQLEAAQRAERLR